MRYVLAHGVKEGLVERSTEWPGLTSEHLKRSPWPLGHASTRQALRELREQHRVFVAAFREAAAQWMRGDFSAPFALYSFPPRIVPSPPTRIL
ncbi:hypothetical protein [Cystobacter fuscus]|uniref:hypothetical protein n=1 Tax=Cystobacter fuscus TaxID=43 RepID=UPI0037BE9F99